MDAKHRGRFSWRCLAVGFVLIVMADAGAKGPKPSPLMQVANLPHPPQQQVPWTAPKTKLPAEFLTATERLFAQGLADPRSCE
jgi:hypothetical protein